MREFKFRAWHKKRKVYSYFDFTNIYGYEGEVNGVILPDGAIVLNYNSGFGNTVINEDLEIEQFISLKDKNGKEIYEGDILTVESWDTANFHNNNNKKIYYGAVSFKYGGYGCFDHNFRFDNPVDNLYYDAKHLEIAGNIHENPELLEAENAKGY